MTYGGLIKGAICYGLGLEMIHEKETEGNETLQIFNYNDGTNAAIHSTIMLLVLSTTILYGSFMNQVRQWLLGNDKEVMHT